VPCDAMWRRRLVEQLDRIERKCDQLLVQLSRQENTLMATLDDVQADVTAQTTVVASAVTLLQGLSAQLAAAIASGDPARIQAIKDAIDSNTTTLAAAVAANTTTP